MPESAHVLVVANRTAESDELLAAMRERAEKGVVRFTLLVPATPHGVAWATDMHSGEDEAEKHLARALERLRSAGLEVEAVRGDGDPGTAVQDVLNAGEVYDDVVVSTLPSHVSRWLKLDLPHRVERITGLPVLHVEAKEAGDG